MVYGIIDGMCVDNTYVAEALHDPCKLSALSSWGSDKGLNNFFSALNSAIESTVPHLQRKPNSGAPLVSIKKFSTLPEMISGKIPSYSKIVVRGKYSAFVPLLKLFYLFPKAELGRSLTDQTPAVRIPFVDASEYSLPIKLNLQSTTLGLAGLYSPSARGVYDTFLPVFYDLDLMMPHDLTGHIVEIGGILVDVPEVWSSFYYPRPSEVFGNKALLMTEIKGIKSSKEFLLDLWRLDYFSYSNDDGNNFEFYERKLSSRSSWPKASRIIWSYLGFYQAARIVSKRLSTFGILPRINVVDKAGLRLARKNLSTFYTYSYYQSKLNPDHWLSLTSVGHGKLDPRNYKKAINMFQYDQVEPVVEQEFSLRRKS